MAVLVRQIKFTNVGIVHGYQNVTGKPPLDDLAGSCRSLGMQVDYPDLPEKTGQPKLSAWLEALNRSMPVINETSALVALSLGCPTVLQWLAQEERIREVGLLVLISSGTRSVVTERGYGFLDHFFEGLDGAIVQVARKARRIEVLTSDNDPWSIQSDILDMARRLGASFHSIHGGGHLDTDTGFTRFPLVLDMISPVF